MICYYAPFHTIRGLLITSHVDILRAAVHKLYVYIRNREIDHISITTNRSPLPTTITTVTILDPRQWQASLLYRKYHRHGERYALIRRSLPSIITCTVPSFTATDVCIALLRWHRLLKASFPLRSLL